MRHESAADELSVRFPETTPLDPNQSDQVTGYDVYRSSDPATPPSTWPLVASDIIDMDEATPNKQWVDTSGDVSPSGTWYFQGHRLQPPLPSPNRRRTLLSHAAHAKAARQSLRCVIDPRGEHHRRRPLRPAAQHVILELLYFCNESATYEYLCDG